MPGEVVSKLENAPLPQMVESLALAISDAQLAMDRNSIAAFQLMARTKVEIAGGPGVSMIELGLMPSFYHFSQTTIEARVAFSMMRSSEWGVKASAGGGYMMFTASVEASYSSKYSFSAEGSSMVSAKIVTVPPPAEVVELIRRLSASRDAAHEDEAGGE